MRLRRSKNPWNLPTVRAFGKQLERATKDLERTERRPALWPRAAFAAVLIAAVAVVAVLVFPSGRSAQATNIINEAPAAAEHAGSLSFTSTLTIRAYGQRRPGITEAGSIDFLTGDYTTTTHYEATHERLERRRVGGTIYATRAPAEPAANEATIWYSAPAEKGTPGGFASESDAFTDPPALFRSLAHISAPVRRVGHEDRKGVPTTVYELSSDLAAFLRANAGHQQNLAGYSDVRATLRVSIDSQGRPRRVEETFKAGATVLVTEVSFSGYGQFVAVQAPPRAQVRAASGIVRPNPLGAGPGSLLAPLLFFQAHGAHAPARHVPTTKP
jgi:hypothetical protein